MIRHFLVIVIGTLLSTSAFAATLKCTIGEAIAGSYFTRTVELPPEHTEFIKSPSGSVKGFISFANGHAVINLTVVHNEETTYVITDVSQGQEATLAVSPFDNHRQVEVRCLRQQ